jgi:hypothetical protein
MRMGEPGGQNTSYPTSLFSLFHILSIAYLNEQRQWGLHEPFGSCKGGEIRLFPRSVPSPTTASKKHSPMRPGSAATHLFGAKERQPLCLPHSCDLDLLEERLESYPVQWPLSCPNASRGPSLGIRARSIGPQRA